MYAKLCKDKANVAADTSGEMWHKRFGHMSVEGMHILVDQKLLREVKGVHLEKCVDCLVRKRNRAAFNSRSPKRKEATLELVHTDVCYVDAPSPHGGQYIVTFNDYSRNLW